ncbi:MAG: BT_3928 family protein [Bacteroidota bacterium]
MKITDQISRFIVGCLFIFSGLIKLNDPIGTKIKMEEYFEVFASDFGSFFEVFIPWALEIAMIMIVLEIVLGVAVLLLYRMNLTTWALLVLMIFFTFLTGYSAILNKVTDCGCFGDFIKLTPWQSFWKDIFLMFFVVHLFWYRKNYVAVLRSREGHFAIIATTILATYLGVHAINHLPYLDWRAYRVGNNIPHEMQPPAVAIGEYVFKKDGKEVKSEKYLSPNDGYEYVSYRIVNEDEIKPKITDYSVTDMNGNDITQSTFAGPKLIFVMVDVNTASTKNINAIRDLIQSTEKDADAYILTASSADDTERFRHENQVPVPYNFVDATVLKTIIRSNPGISLWKDGTVLGNWHHNDTPTGDEVRALLNK